MGLKKRVLLFPLIGFLFLSCGTSNPYSKVDDAVSRGDYQGGIQNIEKEKEDIYRDKDAILYYLDKGMLTHYAEQYDDSAGLLQDAEQRIEEAFTKSITLEIGSYLLNDTTREYDGEDYEDIYINTFNALNYYHKDNLEDALVEIRRMSEKLQVLESKYGESMSSLQQEALEKNVSVPQNEESTSKFSDSALARYLGMLFYRGDGYYDDARIDRDYLKVAFANAPSVYNYRLPSTIDEELDIPPGMARLNILGFSGLSPVKREETIRIPIPGPRYVKIALPVMESRPSSISRVGIVFDDGKTYNLELLEDMEAVARETFKGKAAMIYLKSVLRGTLKGATSSALDAAADNTDGTTGAVFSILSIGTQIFAEASEKADLRLGRYFPAKAYIGGITLKPGTYSFKIQYYAENGQVIASFDHKNVRIRENSLNLVETVCLK